MKKVLVVLLIAVLAVSAVFAAESTFTGDFTSTVKYDLDKESLTFTQELDLTAGFKFGFFDGSVASAAVQGEGYPYAVLEGGLSLGFDDTDFTFGYATNERVKPNALWNANFNNQPSTTNFIYVDDPGDYEVKVYHDVDPNTEVNVRKSDGTADEPKNAWTVYDVTDLRFSFTPSKLSDILTKAVIVGENWELNLLKNFGTGDFAKNALAADDTYEFKASDKVSATSAYNMNNSVKEGDGVTFTYDGYKVGVGKFTVNNESGQAKDAAVISVQSKDLELAEGVTATAVATYKLNGYAWEFDPSAKVSYEGNDVVATVAADVQIKDEKKSAFDVAVDATYLEDAVTFDFYYASTATAKTPYSSYSAVNKAVLTLDIDYTDAEGARYLLKYANKDDANIKYDISAKDELKQFMSGKASVNVAKFVTLGDISALSVTVDAHDMLNEDRPLHAWNAEVNAATEKYGTSAKFGVADFSVASRTFYAEATTDFAKFAELPVNSLTLTVGSNDIDMDANVYAPGKASNVDCLYASVSSEINEAVTVGLTGNYLAGKARRDILGVSATFTGVEGLTVGAKVDHEFASDIKNKNTNVELNAKYACDLVTVTGLVKGTFVTDDEASSKFGAYVGAESTTLVNGATIGLYYSELNAKGDDVTVNWTDPGNAGYFAAVCKIAF